MALREELFFPTTLFLNISSPSSFTCNVRYAIGPFVSYILRSDQRAIWVFIILVLSTFVFSPKETNDSMNLAKAPTDLNPPCPASFDLATILFMIAEINPLEVMPRPVRILESVVIQYIERRFFFKVFIFCLSISPIEGIAFINSTTLDN